MTRQHDDGATPDRGNFCSTAGVSDFPARLRRYAEVSGNPLDLDLLRYCCAGGPAGLG